MDFDELLEELKADYTDFNALIVMDDAALRRYVLSWSPQLVRRHNDYPLGTKIGNLWDCVTVDYIALADLTGHSQQQVMAYFRQAQGLQLIWPDGTINDAVTRLLKKRMRFLTGMD